MEIIHEDYHVQIVAYDGIRGNIFGLIENGIDVATGKQRELLWVTVDRAFWKSIDEIKAMLLNEFEHCRHSIVKRRKTEKVLPTGDWNHPTDFEDDIIGAKNIVERFYAINKIPMSRHFHSNPSELLHETE